MSRRFLSRLRRRRKDDPARAALRERRDELRKALIVEDRFRAELEALSPTARVVFAAASAERLLPAYERFAAEDGWGEPAQLRQALDQVWAAVTNDADVEPSARSRARLDGIAPDNTGDVEWKSEWASAALDAVIAVAVVLETAEDPTVEKAADAAQYEVDQIETFVGERFERGKDPLKAEIGLLAAEKEHPLVRETIALLAADLDELGGAEGVTGSTVDKLRARARAKSLPARVEAFTQDWRTR